MAPQPREATNRMSARIRGLTRCGEGWAIGVSSSTEAPYTSLTPGGQSKKRLEHRQVIGLNRCCHAEPTIRTREARQRACALRPEPDRLPARRGGADRPVQLAVRPAPGWHLRPEDRGHRPGALDRGE